MSLSLVPMTVYIDVKGFCSIVNCLNNSITYEWNQKENASLKRTRKYPYEIQVPIQTIGQFGAGSKKQLTSINLYTLQKMNNNTI